MNSGAEQIGKKITKGISESFESLLQEKIEEIEEIEDVISWIRSEEESSKSSNTNRDKILSKISNKIVEQILLHVPQYIGNQIVENIRVNTQDKEKNIKFDLPFTIDPFKPYVEIVKKIDEVDVIKAKIEFQICSEITLQDVKLTFSEKKNVSLDNMRINLKIALLSSIVGLSDLKATKEFNFEVDLSDIKLEF